MREAPSAPLEHRRAAGLLLAAGWIVFWSGAVNPWSFRFFTQGSPEEFLAVVAEHADAWLFVAVAFAVGVVATLAGWTVLADALRPRGAAVWGELGRTAYTVAATLWLASIGFRATGTLSAARSEVPPDWYGPLWAWAGALFAVHMVLAYLAVAAFGRGLVVSGLAPRWGRVHLAFGLAGAVGFVARIPLFDPPLLIHPVPGLFGLWLAFGRRRAR